MAEKASCHTSRGYQVNFVEQPPKEIEVECSVCFNVLFEPKLATCCGHSFCAACIDPIESGGKPCPLCSQQIELVDDKRLERTLNGLTVYCPHKKKGCEWTGELREVNNHLNKQPTTDNLLKGCQYQEILCEVCQSHQCERQHMENHVSNDCPEREIECEYHSVGCVFKGPQLELGQHMSESINIHLSLLAKFVQGGLSKKGSETEKLKEELKQQREINAVQVQQLTEQSQQVQQQCAMNLLLKCIILCCLLVLSILVAVDVYSYLTLNSEPAISLPNCSQNLQEEQLSSRYVKKIDVIGLDEQIQKLNHAATQMKTDIRSFGGQILQLNDGVAQVRTDSKAKVDELKLVIGKITQDIDWVKSRMNNMEQTLTDIQWKQDKQKPNGAQESCTCGSQSNTASEEIQQIRSEVQYLGERVDFPVLPFDLNLTHLRERKLSKSRWLSMPFYTHQGGYKMRLVVHPNGVKSGAGTHISVALHLMNGRYDDHLDWPPNIVLKVTLFNQLSTENDHHIIKSFTFSQYHQDSTVINKVWRDTMARNGIQIVQFASHCVAFTRTDSYSYLEHNSLYFRVEVTNTMQ